MLVKHKSDTTCPTANGFETLHSFRRILGNEADLHNVHIDIIKCYHSDYGLFKKQTITEKKLAEIKTLLI